MSIFQDKPAALVAYEADEAPNFDISEHIGHALIVDVLGIENVETRFGTKPAVRANVVSVDDGTVYEDVLIFNKVPVEEFAKTIGQRVVVRIDAYLSKKWGKQVVTLAAPKKADLVAAEKVLASLSK